MLSFLATSVSSSTSLSSSLSLKQTKISSMAATLTLMKLPSLPPRPSPATPIPKPKLSTIPTKPLSPQTTPQALVAEAFRKLESASLPLTALTLPFLFDPKVLLAFLYAPSFVLAGFGLIERDEEQSASAAGGEFGILEGRSLALIHPIVMGSLFLYTLWAGYLGWQWRRVRTVQNEINELKKQVKPAPVTPDGAAAVAPPSPVELKIQQLTEERKELVKGSFRDRHFNAGSILLGFGVFESVGGGLNTWLRTGKLFPGPHLFAGAGITILWAAAAALVPAMQKGNETARSLHIALNAINVLLFIWQIPTGIEIVFKVFEFTSWP